MEEHGIDRPTFVFIVSGLALQPDEGARLADLFNPYATVLDQWDAPAAAARAAGLVEEDGGRWRLTAKGRALASRTRVEADAYLATLEPLPRADLVRLAELLDRARGAVEASGVPHDHMRRTARFVGDARIPMVALENALFGLWQARDDCHMAAWRSRGLSGPLLDALTRIWRGEAATEDELARVLGQQRPPEVREALARLRADGLVEGGALRVTDRGARLRQAVEDETDRAFFAPWPDEVGGSAPWIAEQLRQVNTALAPAS